MLGDCGMGGSCENQLDGTTLGGEPAYATLRMTPARRGPCRQCSVHSITKEQQNRGDMVNMNEICMTMTLL